ncbi:MAG TPA: proton-conducting transporter membrane subunit, partial [Thermoplasmata archaeon]|nr:proton-conducting transporter membrane subunit [Thermoplasmata archaeon]
AAGAVIHVVETQDLFKMGGLRKTMRITSVGFLIGGLSLAGIPPLAGFFSKDDVLGSVYTAAQTHPLYWPFLLLAYLTVFMTAYYIFRVWFLTFSGDHPRDPTLPHAHAVPWTMTVPIVLLSGLAVVAGLLAFVPQFGGLFTAGVGFPATPGVPPVYTSTDLVLSAVSVSLGAGGILTAYVLWGDGRVFHLSEDSAAQPIRRLLLERYYVKAGVDWFGLRVVYTLSRLADFADTYIIDGTVHGFERLFSELSLRMRRLQSGIVLDYAAYVIVGLAVFLLFLFLVVPAFPALGGG